MNEKCQVFTPENYVEKLLDSIGYLSNLYGKKIMENSCGDGNILISIIRRYILDCRKNGLTNANINYGLSQDIFGVEIDSKYYVKCIENLDAIIEDEGIEKVKWKIINEDYLRSTSDIKFDFIVGNPPYVTYSEIKEIERKYVKNNFATCKEGKFDYCYAFIEKSLLSLEKNGKMAYLIPSSIFKTVFGKNLRHMIKNYVVEIIDYTEEKVFDNALVKSAIMILQNNKHVNSVRYFDIAKDSEINIKTENLADKWFFTNTGNSGNKKYGEYFQISHVVATLLNEAFVIKNWEEQDKFIISQNYKIEKSIIRETATPRSLKYNKPELIIFPYQYVNGVLIKFSETDFVNNFPGATAYLNNYREKLDARKKDESSQWFEYGRSQALNGLDCEKMLLSTVITEQVYVYTLDKKCIPYGGMYITSKNQGFTLEEGKEILMSDRFIEYVGNVGIHISGNSLRITSKDIMEYRF